LEVTRGEQFCKLAGMATTAELLAANSEAMLRCFTSQEYIGPHGMKQRMADLRELRITRKELMEETEAASQGSMCSLLRLDTPSE
jgi:hypothetical protein